MKLRLLALALVLCALSLAQPASTTHTQQLYYNGTALQYVCDAPANVVLKSWKLTDSTLTNLVVATNVGTFTTAAAHNLWDGAAVLVTAPNTAGITGLYTVRTVPSSTTFTVTTSGVGDGTYADGGLMVQSNSPALNEQVWYISVMHYASGLLDGAYPGGGSVSLAYRAKCSDRALY